MTDPAGANENWSWIVRYVAMIAVVLLLSAALGSMDLFAKTTIGNKPLSAADLVRFLGYGAALAAFWMLGQRLALVFRQRGGRWGFVQHLILPTVTLIVIAASYSVVLLVLRHFMDLTTRGVYKWIFIVAIVGVCVWLVAAVLGQSNSLTDALTSKNKPSDTPTDGHHV